MRKVNYLEMVNQVSGNDENIPAGIYGPFFKTSDGRVFKATLDHHKSGRVFICLDEVIYFDDKKVED